MKNLGPLLMSLLLCMMFAESKAQSLDTVRRKDADNWEYIQVWRGKIQVSAGYKHNGLLDGIWTTYWETGLPMHITSFKKGKKDGSHVQVESNGYTIMIENYKNDLLEGPRRLYPSGTGIMSEEAYYSAGKKHGSFIKKYADGKTQEESSYNMGERDGKTIWYYENGEKAAEYNYRNGTIDGEVSVYNENGKVTEFGLYKNNLQTGTWKEFYANGNLKAEGKYVDGEKDGPWKEYSEDGKQTGTVTYNKGQIN